MTMTEQEARTRLCPMQLSTVNINLSSMNGYCKASHCMAWRWMAVDSVDNPDPKVNPPRGFCGMAYAVRLP